MARPTRARAFTVTGNSGLPHHLCPDTITSPMLPGRQGRLSGWLQFTFLYLCSGINHSHPSTNPYLWLSKSQGQIKGFHLYSTCFPSPTRGPALVCHCPAHSPVPEHAVLELHFADIYATFIMYTVSSLSAGCLSDPEMCTYLGSIDGSCAQEHAMCILACLPSWWTHFLRTGLSMTQLCVPYRGCAWYNWNI